MTNLLVKLFIKNKETDVTKAKSRYSVLASIVGIVTNSILAIVKLMVGAMLNSVSIMADAVNNLTDSITNIMVIFSSKFANRPADKEHPFGHAKIEYLSTLVIAVMMLFLGFEFVQSSVESILNPESLGFDLVLVGILALSGLVKLWQSSCYKKLGIASDSSELMALSKDSINDVLIAIAIVSSLIFTHFTGITIDGYVGVFISLIILYSGFKLAKETISKVLGEAVDHEKANEIIELVKSYDGIMDTHDLVIHHYGAKIMATLKVDLCETLTLKESHIMISQIERETESKLGIHELTIRVTPIPINDERFNQIKEVVQNFIDTTDNRLSTNDLKIVDNETRTDVIFELDIPYDYNDEQAEEMIAKLAKEIKLVNSNYHPIIELDRAYVLKKDSKINEI